MTYTGDKKIPNGPPSPGLFGIFVFLMQIIIYSPHDFKI